MGLLARLAIYFRLTKMEHVAATSSEVLRKEAERQTRQRMEIAQLKQTLLEAETSFLDEERGKPS
jgi:hypothetical protein